MHEERKASVVIGGQEYELLLTMGATRKISAKYGGVLEFGEALLGPADLIGKAEPGEPKRQEKSKGYDEQAEHVLWMLALLINQTILIHNKQHPNDRKELITEEHIELFSLQFQLPDYISAICKALNRGAARDIPAGEPPEDKGGKGKNAKNG
jgi:hypothetical protein